jgi:hypothetical protein
MSRRRGKMVNFPMAPGAVPLVSNDWARLINSRPDYSNRINRTMSGIRDWDYHKTITKSSPKSSWDKLDDIRGRPVGRIA